MKKGNGLKKTSSSDSGLILANRSMSTQTSNEGEIRKVIIATDLVECMVSLSGQLFYCAQRTSLN